MSNHSFNRVLVTLVILIALLSGLSAFTGTWDHKSNTTMNDMNAFSGFSHQLSQNPAKVNTVNTSFNTNDKDATWITFDPSNNYLYENNFTGNIVSAINTTTNSIVVNLSLGIGSYPYYMAYDPVNTYLYVDDYGTGNISVINSTTNSIVKNITMGIAGYSYLSYDPANTYMFVVNSASGASEISAINTTTDSIVKTTTLDTSSIPVGIAYDPANTYLYIITTSDVVGGNLTIINPATYSVVSTLTIGLQPKGIAYDPANGCMYITNAGSSNVSVINTATDSMVKSITVGSTPFGIAYDPADMEIYVSNSGSDGVSVINTTTNSVVAVLGVGSEPSGIAYDSSNTNVYVVNLGSDSVSEIITEDAYRVIFEETGLPAGSTWYVNITDLQPSPLHSSPITGNNFTINLINGTYAYTVESANKGYGLSSTFGTFNVSGSDESMTVHFSTSYPVTFVESGLPPGTAWSIETSGQQSSGTINGDNYTMNLPNGTYTYAAMSSNSSFKAYGGASFTVNGAAVSKDVTFLRVYQVHFISYDIPTSQTWYLNLSNGDSYKSTSTLFFQPASVPMETTEVSFSVPNGTYYYTIATVDKNYEPNGTTPLIFVEPAGVTGSSSSGSFTIAGADLYELVNFSYAFKTTFTESGLPVGTPWYVNLSNGQLLTSTTDTITSYLPNGTYSYSAATSDKTYSPEKGYGTFTVNNSSASESVSFKQILYKVSIAESGLPAGTAWYINGTDVSGNSTSQDLAFELPNGTYTFRATNLSSYYASVFQFTVTIDGHNVTENIYYYHWAYITGTVSPGNATLSINGNDVAVSSSGSFNVSVANGTYYVEASDSGYHSFSTNVTIGNGEVKNLSIELKAINQNAPLSPYAIYGAIAGVVAVSVVGVAIYTMRRK